MKLITILTLFIISCSPQEELFISLNEDNCITYEKLNHSIINDTVNQYLPEYSKLEILIENTTDEKVKFITIKNLTENAILLNSPSRDYPKNYSDEFKECRNKKGYNLLIKEYESEYSITIVIDSEKKLLPKELFKIRMRFKKQGIYKIITQSYNRKAGEGSGWGLQQISQHQSDLFEIN